jgi:hypothetical protein
MDHSRQAMLVRRWKARVAGSHHAPATAFKVRSNRAGVSQRLDSGSSLLPPITDGIREQSF